jgi:hypothetical protein
MAADACLVLYGNSIFLAGIKAELEQQVALKLITIESGCTDAANLIRDCNPCLVLFDLASEQPGLAVSLLREQPGLMLIGVDPSSDELLVLSGQPQPALSMADLVKVINHIEPG